MPRTTPAAERAIIWLYWLISGYGLRALRSLAALVIVGVIVTTALVGWGLAASAPAPAPDRHRHEQRRTSPPGSTPRLAPLSPGSRQPGNGGPRDGPKPPWRSPSTRSSSAPQTSR